MPIPICVLAAATTGAVFGSIYHEQVGAACTSVRGAARATATSVYNFLTTLSTRKAPPEKPDAKPTPESAAQPAPAEMSKT
jgi:hypothetical protein